MANTGDIEPIFLSASSNGRNIKVAATGTPGTLIHTTPSGLTSVDLITLVASNTSTASGEDPVRLTVEFGGVTSPDDHIVSSIPAGTQVVVADRLPLNNGLLVRAFGDYADVVTINGFIRRVTL